MLSPAYLEGQALSSDDPPIIGFAEDKGEPFHILCSLLHHRKMEETPNEHDLVDLVILADKYGCVPTISSHLSFWFKLIMPAT